VAPASAEWEAEFGPVDAPLQNGIAADNSDEQLKEFSGSS
jgi:hypothetical protein